eukprot:scaffold5831_cov77-Cylindrotheca_fusiformis.AAC.1
MIATTGDTFPPPADPTAPFQQLPFCPMRWSVLWAVWLISVQMAMMALTWRLQSLNTPRPHPPCSGYSSTFLVGKIEVDVVGKCVNLDPGFHTILVRDINPSPDELDVSIDMGFCGSTIAPYNCCSTNYIGSGGYV